MSITEQPVRIEFTYIPDTDKTINVGPDLAQYVLDAFEARYDVLYFVENEIPLVKITDSKRSEQTAIFHIDFLVEVVDFLRSKGVIGPGKNVLVPKTNVSPGISVPNIVTKDGQGKLSESAPFTSFDVSPEKVQPQVPKKIPEGPVISAEDQVEITKRSVIKTRVTNKDDPLQVERDAELLRGGKVESNFRRTD